MVQIQIGADVLAGEALFNPWRPCQAFPNAYLEVDEPPNHMLRERILALVGMVGLLYFGLTILVLHFEPTGYDPIRQVVSDYAVGPFSAVMSAGFFAGGTGLTALGLELVLSNCETRSFKVGAILFLTAGLALFLVGGFATDLEGHATTFHGTLHGLLSQVVFSFGPIGLLLISYNYGRRWLAITLSAYVITGAFFAANLALSLGENGLSERFFVLFLLTAWTATSYLAFRNHFPGNQRPVR